VGWVCQGAGVAVTPMFPLGTVLVPGMVLPLHVFEPRYRQMVDDCMAADRTFGVVLIERGSEVGGGDVRTDIGTRAGIVRAEQQPDGRWGLIAVGLRRIRVDRWLPDAPYRGPRSAIGPMKATAPFPRRPCRSSAGPRRWLASWGWTRRRSTSS